MISSRLNNKSEPLFARGKKHSIHYIIASTLALALMFCDNHYHYLNNVRSSFSMLLAPLQYTVDYPMRVFGWMQSAVSTKTALIDENMELRYQQTVLESELQRLMMIKEENLQLKELLHTSARTKTRSMAAQILAVDTSMARQIVILNKGKRNGAYVGQPVLDAKGVMGQIIDVGYMTSTVLLISDAKSAIPVRNNRSGERAILVGSNSLNQLSLINVPRTANVALNDLLVTSGLGRLYPEGYPVGKVATIHDIPGEDFITVEVRPIALLNRNRLVLLIWPGTNETQLTYQINERLHAIEAMS